MGTPPDYYCCAWDSSLPTGRQACPPVRWACPPVRRGLRPQNDNFFVLFFYCHPEGNTRRIPRLLALCSYYCCGWDSSLPAVGGPARRRWACPPLEGLPAVGGPARRLGGAPLRMTKNVQNDKNCSE